METLRTPLFVMAVFLIALVVLVELGMRVMGIEGVPGLGIPDLVFLHGFVLFVALLVGAALLLPERIHGRVQGITTLVVSFVLGLASLKAIFTALASLIVMLALFMSPPFGTAAYLVAYASFSRASAAAALSLLTLLLLGFAVFLILAQQRFLQNKGLVCIILTALVATLIVSFLHGLVPGFLVSITDAIAAIVVAVLALIWAIYFFIRSIPSIIKALRVDRAAA